MNERNEKRHEKAGTISEFTRGRRPREQEIETAPIERFGYQVVPAKSGEKAVEIGTGNDNIAFILACFKKQEK